MGGDRDAPARRPGSARRRWRPPRSWCSAGWTRRRRAAKAAICSAGGGVSPNSSIWSAIHGRPVAGSTTSPAELTDDQRADGHPGIGSVDRGGADAALEHAGPRPDAGADGADRHVHACRTARPRYPNSAVGRHSQPPTGRSKITAAGHDRHHTALHRHAALVLLQPAHDAVGGGQPVGAAAGEHHRVDVRTVLAGSSRSVSRVPGAPPRTVDRADRPGRRQHDGGAAGPARPQGRVGSSRRGGRRRMPADVGDGDSSGCRHDRSGLPISTSTRYSCSTVSHW